LKPKIKVAFASGTDELNRQLIERMRALFPELPLYVVSDFPPEDADLRWVPYRVNRSLRDNLARCLEELRGQRIRLAGVMLVPNVPFRRMRLMALLLSPLGFLAFNENLNNFMLRPQAVPAILRHVAWRAKNAVRWSLRAARQADWGVEWAYARARVAGWVRPRWVRPRPANRGSDAPAAAGISVVIPSRNGSLLLAAQLPGIMRDLEGIAAEVLVVDNGSDDGTAAWLGRQWPQVRVEVSAAPLSFARAVNRGVERSGFSHVCLLNNDMLIEPGFFRALLRAFEDVPSLFCATAQIRFPEGVRREETGKTVMAQAAPEDFPVRCDEPLPGEDLTCVLYGSGGCSLYDAARLHMLGNVNEAFEPAYVEDLDLGYRAWQRGWPSVYVAGAVVEHRHRATTSRYYSEAQLQEITEVNYLRFLAGAVSSPAVFRRLWRQAIRRLGITARRKPAPVAGAAVAGAAVAGAAVAGAAVAGAALRVAAGIALAGGAVAAPAYPEESFLALTGGAVAAFPGRTASGKPRVLVASPYLPFPLSHGGAVRMYNLMRRAAAEFDQVLVAFTGKLETPPPELLDICAEVVLVQRAGSHSLPSTDRPEVVEEFDSPAFRAALEQTVRKWRPGVAQLEFTQMAEYAPQCQTAKTLLVEHDVTFDLYGQMLRLENTWELRRQRAQWEKFERAAWRAVDCVVTMSEQDRRLAGARAVTLPNGVDLDRFRPPTRQPEPRRLLFIGSFAHLPNLMAVEFFLERVWPLLGGVNLHLIAGARHEYYLNHYRDRVSPNLVRHLERPVGQPGVELEGFVADVRGAYERAAVVIAPLVASAGTNIKILEAMAMGRAIVSTPAGVNGLDLQPGRDFVLAQTAAEMAAAIANLLDHPDQRRVIEAAARQRVEREFGWDEIARSQASLYRRLFGESGLRAAAGVRDVQKPEGGSSATSSPA
jgi:glycosyltransferase involved in cell wall biosynthesis/GT2 family glycosyltransferase